MAFDWTLYLTLAETFKGLRENEAAQRSCVSRAYYSAFCLTRNYADINDIYCPTGKSFDHEELRKRLEADGYEDEAELLKDLRKWRNQCDYDDVVANIPRLVEESIPAAQDVIDKFS